MNATSAPLARGVNEMERAGLEPAPSRLVKPPRVKASPCALECKLHQDRHARAVDGKPVDCHVVFGQVVGVHIDDRFIVDGLLDTAAMKPIARCGYDQYAVVESVFSDARPACEPERPAGIYLYVITRAQAPCHVSVTRLRQHFHHIGAIRLSAAGPIDNRGRGDTFGVRRFIRARAATATATPKPRPRRRAEVKRPSIALALGGGAARGFAHIGVMRTLAAHGIVPDIIVGTSIGAVVGGCYAAGSSTARDLGALADRARHPGYLDISLSGSGLIRGGHLAARLEEALDDTPH